MYFPLVVRNPKPQGDHFPRYTKTQHFLVLFSLYLVICLLLLHINQLFVAKPLNSKPTQVWKTNYKLFDNNATNRQAINPKVPGNTTWEHYTLVI